jgi:hypothetical protein
MYDWQKEQLAKFKAEYAQLLILEQCAAPEVAARASSRADWLEKQIEQWSNIDNTWRDSVEF